jgi:Flp pilus assembly protein TadD
MNPAFSCRSRLFLLVFYVLAAVGIAHTQGPNTSQTPELHGQVQRADGSPFGDGATVKVELGIGGMAAQVMTDSRGRFDVVLQQPGRFVVTVHASGYRDATAEVDLATTPRAYVQLTLRELPALGSRPDTGTVSTADLGIPEAARTELEKGRVLLIDKNKPGDSVKPISKAIQIAPAYPQAHFLLGTAYMDMGKLGDAETELNKAISLNEKLDAAYFELGACLIEQKKFAEAEKPLLRGLEAVPDSAQGQYDLGRTYYALNRFPEAKAAADKAVAVKSDFPEAHLLLGNVLLRLRDGPHALAEFQEYLRLAPNGPFAGPAQELVKKLQAALPDGR